MKMKIKVRTYEEAEDPVQIYIMCDWMDTILDLAHTLGA